MKKFLTVILVLLLASITIFLGFSNKRNSQPHTYYQVTLDGELRIRKIYKWYRKKSKRKI